VDIFVFLDEHPDSINDGYFLERDYYLEWHDLPATYHNSATAFSFADGHAQLHRWREPDTYRPAAPDAANLPILLPSSRKQDLEWVLDHMSMDRN
jgi:prepilin-type processing-associated H-X9-DG protein